MEIVKLEQTAVNDSGTTAAADTPLTRGRSPSDPVKSALHGKRIRQGNNHPATARLTVLHDGIDVLNQPEGWAGQHAYQRAILARAARELPGVMR